ncbi:hypothetical protein IKE_06017 [Bacillus cereus VD196]|uniref:Resolvase/invertase-type recombinase catalytic domain-containing protein n=1 Tax=Bacillus cereus VD196 TaxID=1053243 RepID=A0A9W5PY66_BACCE|nr:hypothetical protein IKE_06017 [Bacillus cereus VD196]
MIYGYARVSAQDQNLDTQIEQLLKYGVDKIVKEKISAVSQEKIELDDLLSQLIKGDTLVVTRMDRLGRNTIQLLQFVENLREKGVHFAVLNLGIDTRGTASISEKNHAKRIYLKKSRTLPSYE